MPIKVNNIYKSKDLQRSHDGGFYTDVLAEAAVTVTAGPAPYVWEFNGLRIREKKDGSGLQVLSPSQKLEGPDGSTVYQPLYSIPKEWYPKVSEAVVAEYNAWVARGGEPVAASDDDELEDPFALA